VIEPVDAVGARSVSQIQQAALRGVSAETLINLWLSEKLHDAGS
jgi:hypothetical protein